ncbi:MAG: hypothetical protein H6634_11935 [Anaerolineales bacterium]|nr:hypothetical protein [Anaerolineales bacterium]
MKTGTCPNCGSESIVISKEGGGIGYGARIYIKLGWAMSTTPAWTTYLCVDCGYFENYIMDKEKLEKIKSDPEKAGWKKFK